MADVSLFRGGTADFKGWFRRGDYAEFTPPFNAPHMASTPPYNSHADAAYGQGYLNLHFPLVPHLEETTAHEWMWNALKKLSAVGDKIYTNWIPSRAYVDALHWELVKVDEELTGVYIKPCAVRVKFNFTTNEFEYEDNTDYDTMLTTAGITQFPLGKIQAGDAQYAFVENTNKKCTFGHNMVKYDATTGKPTEGLDDYYGCVVLGYEITEGDPEKIAKICTGNFALYFSAKLLAFEGSSQV